MPLFFASSALYPIAIMLHLGGRLVVARLRGRRVVPGDHGDRRR
jgi:hypothetical protein